MRQAFIKPSIVKRGERQVIRQHIRQNNFKWKQTVKLVLDFKISKQAPQKVLAFFVLKGEETHLFPSLIFPLNFDTQSWTMIESIHQLLEYEKKASPILWQAYRHDLDKFQEFALLSFEKRFYFGSLMHTEIRAWVIDLGRWRSTVVLPSTRKWQTLRRFYKFFVRSRLIKKDPTLKLKSLKTPTDFLNLYRIDHRFRFRGKLCMNCATFWKDNVGQKWLLSFLYQDWSSRLSELIGLKWSDINLIRRISSSAREAKKKNDNPYYICLKTEYLSYNTVLRKGFQMVGKVTIYCG